MSEVSGVSGPGRPDIRTDAPETARAPSGLPIDTGRAEGAAPPPRSTPTLPPGPSRVDYGLAASAAGTMSHNVAFDASRVAALMMLLDAELQRSARDEQVQEIKAVADQSHAAADDIRASAKMALAGGVVSGAGQIASAGVSVGGGIKGMSLTSGAAATEAASVTPETVSGPEEGATPTGAAPEETEGAAGTAPGGADGTLAETGEAASGDTEVEEASGEDARDTVKDMADAKQKATATRLNHTLSQQLSARAQNIALVTEGVSKMTAATGELIKSALDYEARQKEAESKDDEARAEQLRSYLERTKGFADAMQKGAQDNLQIYQQVEDTETQTGKQIWRA